MEHPTDRPERDDAIRRLATELEKINRRLGRLVDEPADLVEAQPDEPATDVDPERLLSAARAVQRYRARRGRYLPQHLLGEPVWDILLDLYIARADRGRLPVGTVCIGAMVPPTTALRYIRTLTDEGLIVRMPDVTDGRRVYLSLTPSAVAMMERLLADATRTFASYALSGTCDR